MKIDNFAEADEKRGKHDDEVFEITTADLQKRAPLCAHIEMIGYPDRRSPIIHPAASQNL